MYTYLPISVNLFCISILILFYFTSNKTKFEELSNKLDNLVVAINMFILGWSIAIYKASSALHLSDSGLFQQSTVELIQTALNPLTVHFTIPVVFMSVFTVILHRLKDFKEKSAK